MKALKWLALQILDESDEEAPDEEEGAEAERDHAGLKEDRRLHCALAEPLVDKRALADLVWLGVHDGHGRSEAWQMLLGYRPLLQERRAAALQRKRCEYRELRRELLDGVPALGAGTAVGSWEPLGDTGEAVALDQIRRDLPRLVLSGSEASAPDGPLARLQDLVRAPRARGLMERVLLLWAVRQPAAGYVQGQHDVLLPLLLVFLADRAGVGLASGDLGAETLDSLPPGALDDVEADCFWCLSKLLGEVADYYTEGQPGLQRAAVLLRSVLAGADAALVENMEAEGIQFPVLVQRWLGCLMVRELPLPLCVRLWDTCVAELVLVSGGSFGGFLVYFCAGFLARHSARLRYAPFDELMEFVQRPPTEDLTESDLEALISEAYVLRSAPGGLSPRQARADAAGGPGAPSSTRTTSASPTSTPRWSSQASEAEEAEDSPPAAPPAPARELLQPPPPPMLLPPPGLGGAPPPPPTALDGSGQPSSDSEGPTCGRGFLAV